MKKLMITVFFALLLLLVIPPALEGPVRSLLSALLAAGENRHFESSENRHFQFN